MDEYSRYNQMYIAKKDVQKTAFQCPGALGKYVWKVMSFGLKNAGATNSIFHDIIGKKKVEVYK